MSLFAVALGIETAARRMGCTRLEALFAALFFTAGLMLTTDYAGMDDPQLLGHAIAMGGLLLVLHEPRTPRLMAAAALAFTLAFFVKHNLVVLPAAAAAWLLLADRRHAVPFFGCGLIFLLVGMGIFRQAFWRRPLHPDRVRAHLFPGQHSATACGKDCRGAPSRSPAPSLSSFSPAATVTPPYASSTPPSPSRPGPSSSAAQVSTPTPCSTPGSRWPSAPACC